MLILLASTSCEAGSNGNESKTVEGKITIEGIARSYKAGPVVLTEDTVYYVEGLAD